MDCQVSAVVEIEDDYPTNREQEQELIEPINKSSAADKEKHSAGMTKMRKCCRVSSPSSPSGRQIIGDDNKSFQNKGLNILSERCI